MPLIVNIDSQLDWTQEVTQTWNAIDWLSLLDNLRCSVGNAAWARRRDQLGFIGLCSSLRFERSLDALPRFANTNEEMSGDDHDERKRAEENWAERQSRELNSERIPTCRRARVSRQTVIDYFGLYCDEAISVLTPLSALDQVPVDYHFRPAIFLCPERIAEVFPALSNGCAKLRRELPPDNQAHLAALKLTLLHEVGHHFFPIHRATGNKYVSEAFANYFCWGGLDSNEREWLAYKSYLLQPPEYSAYRPLSELIRVTEGLEDSVSAAFVASMNAFRDESSLNYHDHYRHRRVQARLGAAGIKALSADVAPFLGLAHGVSARINGSNAWYQTIAHDLRYVAHGRSMDTASIPIDLLLDLYARRDLTAWTIDYVAPDFWSGFGFGDFLQWPHDCLNEYELRSKLEFGVERHLYWMRYPLDDRLSRVVLKEEVVGNICAHLGAELSLCTNGYSERRIVGRLTSLIQDFKKGRFQIRPQWVDAIRNAAINSIRFDSRHTKEILDAFDAAFKETPDATPSVR